MKLTQEALRQLFNDIDATGVTMVYLAEQSGITRMTLNNWRAGRTTPTLEKFLSVKEVIDAKTKQILRQKGKLRTGTHA